MEQLIALSVFISVTALMSAVFTRAGSPVQRRLRGFRELAFAHQEEQPEREPSFVERVLRPVYGATRRMAGGVLPSSYAEKLETRLGKAGDPFGLTSLLVLWSGFAVGLPALHVLLVSSTGSYTASSLRLTVMVVLFGAVAPYYWLGIKIKQRRTKILRALPDAIDLLTTSVEAGLGVDAALGQVAEKVKGPVSVELRRLLREMSMGSSRRDALKAFAERIEIPDVNVFVNAIIQAESMGVSLGQVIRVQADQMRMRRRQRAEKLAHGAPVKMSIPMVLFIFPTILVVILGPAGIQIMRNLK